MVTRSQRGKKESERKTAIYWAKELQNDSERVFEGSGPGAHTNTSCVRTKAPVGGALLALMAGVGNRNQNLIIPVSHVTLEPASFWFGRVEELWGYKTA
ncbi:hypothetical protein RRG08_014652 [Elysia crispata]|uniref:Uncharacterized protein n=1 Tax=Elysia crispata TaxID=231223 RepID=A0AAE1CZJ7_9GAST|nr:hypothetical protein RRG08_014652 [Elysia crispata]